MATQLHALKHEGPDAHGVTELLHLAASGRTSIPVDKDTPKALYRMSGYRICGERAVRVDILERLADLIRPALSWREGVSPKPDGAFDGRSFTITGAMTSLTGASGEDFASILRSLGYRMDRKPKPVEKPTEKPAEATATTEATAAEVAPPEVGTEQPAEAVTETPAEVSSSISLLPEADLLPVPESASDAPVSATVPEVGGEVTGLVEAVEASAPIAGDGTVAAPEAASPEAAASESKAEPELIEVWRPGGHGGERRPHHQRPRRGQRPQQAPAADGAAPAPAVAAQPAAADGAPRQEHRGERPERNERRERMERQAKSFNHGFDKRKQDSPQDGRPPRQGRRRERDQVERADRDKYFARPGGGSGGRDKAPDPNSPFAKLAALKQQLEGKDS